MKMNLKVNLDRYAIYLNGINNNYKKCKYVIIKSINKINQIKIIYILNYI